MVRKGIGPPASPNESHQMGSLRPNGGSSAKIVRVSLRGAPLEAEVTIPDGRTVRVRVGPGR